MKGKELGETMLEFPVEMSLLHSVLKLVKKKIAQFKQSIRSVEFSLAIGCLGDVNLKRHAVLLGSEIQV